MLIGFFADEQSQWSLTFEVRKSTMDTAFMPELYKSQWSLTFEVRKSAAAKDHVAHHAHVAMEPDL